MMGAFSIRGKLLISGDLADGALVIENGSITGIERLPGGAQLPQSVIEADIVAPGLIDLQVNGGFGVEVGHDPEAFRRLAAQLPATGVTGFLPTVVSSPPEFYPPIYEAFDAARAAPGAQVLVEEMHPDVVVMDMAMPKHEWSRSYAPDQASLSGS
jgi:N-acetylglucosamine-6-phosphate deacetylase